MYDDLFELMVEGAFANKNEFDDFISTASQEDIYSLIQEGAFKDFEEVIIFNNRAVFNQFITDGWNYTAQGDAVAKYKDDGGAATGEVPLDSDVVVFQMTKDGIALRATIGASKYWVNDELNNPN